MGPRRGRAPREASFLVISLNVVPHAYIRSTARTTRCSVGSGISILPCRLSWWRYPYGGSPGHTSGASPTRWTVRRFLHSCPVGYGLSRSSYSRRAATSVSNRTLMYWRLPFWSKITQPRRAMCSPCACSSPFVAVSAAAVMTASEARLTARSRGTSGGCAACRCAIRSVE